MTSSVGVVVLRSLARAPRSLPLDAAAPMPAALIVVSPSRGRRCAGNRRGTGELIEALVAVTQINGRCCVRSGARDRLTRCQVRRGDTVSKY